MLAQELNEGWPLSLLTMYKHYLIGFLKLCGLGVIIIPIFQLRKLRFRDIKKLAKSTY